MGRIKNDFAINGMIIDYSIIRFLSGIISCYNGGGGVGSSLRDDVKVNRL